MSDQMARSITTATVGMEHLQRERPRGRLQTSYQKVEVCRGKHDFTPFPVTVAGNPRRASIFPVLTGFFSERRV